MHTDIPGSIDHSDKKLTDDEKKLQHPDGEEELDRDGDSDEDENDFDSDGEEDGDEDDLIELPDVSLSPDRIPTKTRKASLSVNVKNCTTEDGEKPSPNSKEKQQPTGSLALDLR